MKPFLILLLLAASCFAQGKTAADYFHGAAYKYIAGRHQEASVEAGEGLQAYPGDPQLQMLNDLLKQMKDQQRQDQNQGGGGQQNKDSKQNQNGKNDQKNDQNKDQHNKEQPPKNSSGQGRDKKPQQPPPQPKPENGAAADSAGKKGDSTAHGGQPPRLPGQMSKEEAERLLNSFVDEEKQAQQQRQGTPRKRAETEQDW